MADPESKTEPNKQLFWGPNHDIFYANAFQFRMSDNDISVELGTIQNINDNEVILSTRQLIMTFKSAKLLSIMLSQTIKAMEGRIGEIKFDDEKIAAIQATLAEAFKKVSSK
jgi:hypothetical protein